MNSLRLLLVHNLRRVKELLFLLVMMRVYEFVVTLGLPIRRLEVGRGLLHGILLALCRIVIPTWRRWTLKLSWLVIPTITWTVLIKSCLLGV